MRHNITRIAMIPALLICLLTSSGCDDDLVTEWASLTSNYVGNVVSAAATSYVNQALGLTAHSEEEEEHTHDSEPLSEHEH